MHIFVAHIFSDTLLLAIYYRTHCDSSCIIVDIVVALMFSFTLLLLLVYSRTNCWGIYSARTVDLFTFTEETSIKNLLSVQCHLQA